MSRPGPVRNPCRHTGTPHDQLQGNGTTWCGAVLLAVAGVAGVLIAIAAAPTGATERRAGVAAPYTNEVSAEPGTTSSSQAWGWRSFGDEPVYSNSLMPQPELLRSTLKSALRRRYPDLGQALHLPVEAEGQFIERLTDKAMSLFDLSSLGASAARTDNGVEGLDRYEAEVAANLGPGTLRYYQDYKATLEERRLVHVLSGMLGEDWPLTSDQKAQMIALLAEQRRVEFDTANTELERRAVEKGVALNEAHLRQMEESSGRLLERLADVLTPAQLARYSELEQRRLGIQRYFMQQKRRAADHECQCRSGDCPGSTLSPDQHSLPLLQVWRNRRSL